MPHWGAFFRFNNHTLRLMTWGAIGLFAVVLFRTAWLCDDAYISFRTIRNFVDGDGLRWNLDERVQAFTHPLWLFMLSAFHGITGELYFTVLAVSMLVALLGVVTVACKIASSQAIAFAAVVALFSSRSFVDFSTSGLENPLTNFLVVSCFWFATTRKEWSARTIFSLSLMISLAGLNRLDGLVLLGPLLVWGFWQCRTSRAVLGLVLGMAPLFAWELFSLAYFGLLVPNTVYAKLPEQIALGSRLFKGVSYLLSCTFFDPCAIVTIVLGLLLAVRSRSGVLGAAALGVLLYLFYVVWVGGDFMAGRFLVAPFTLALCVAARNRRSPSSCLVLVSAAVACLLGLSVGSRSTLVAGRDYGTQWHWRKNIDRRGVADERAVYFKITGLIRERTPFSPPTHAWFDAGRRVSPGAVVPAATLGFFGFSVPPDAIVIDQLGLSDLFIARLPPINTRQWRPGHLDRAIPRGYLEARRTGTALGGNPGLAEFHAKTRLIASGKIFSRARWRAIWELNTGQLDSLVDVDAAGSTHQPSREGSVTGMQSSPDP